MKRFMFNAMLVAVGLALLSMPAAADSVTFTGTGTGVNGATLSASVTFTVSGNNIIVTLTNTASGDINESANLLTGVFFSFAGGSLTAGSAALGSGSTVVNCAPSKNANQNCTFPSGGTDVSGEWAFAQNISGAPGGANTVIASSGFGNYGGSTNRFDNNQNWQGPASVDGAQFGIAPAGYTTTGDNGGLNNDALIVNVAVFTLTGWTGGNIAGLFSNVSFQYGTDISEPNIPGCENGNCTPVPEPGTLALFGTGLLGLAGVIRRRLVG
jgi:hypothetical protein